MNLDPSPALRTVIDRDLGALARRRITRWVCLCTAALVLAPAVISGVGSWPPAIADTAALSRAALCAAAGFALSALAFGVWIPARPWGGAAVGAGLALGVALLFTVMNPHAPDTPGDQDLMCLAAGGSMAAALLLLAAALGRGVRRRHVPAGLLIGSGAGLFALAVLHISCASAEPHHLLLSHGFALASAAVVGGRFMRTAGPSTHAQHQRSRG